MSILFFDEYLNLNKVDKVIKQITNSTEERHEIWIHVEEIVHTRIISCCLTHLEKKDHQAFLEMVQTKPFDKNIIKYLTEKTKKDIRKLIKAEIKILTKELELLK